MMSDRSDPRSRSRIRVGKFELGQTLGEGSFAKVKYARNTETNQQVAIKIIDKEKIYKCKMVDQIKREISTMKLARHPNVVHLYEVMASKTKIYLVMELVTGGELFSKINRERRLKEDEARKYFQQLIGVVDYCHNQGVYHRDLKPENLLLDSVGNLRISDFGLSALSRNCSEDGLFHTTCGTPNYVAPEVIISRGYDGAKADLWSCGIILFVLLAGYLPFDDKNLINLYKKIYKGEFSFPTWFSSGVKNLISKILVPNPNKRMTATEILQDPWFLKGFKTVKHLECRNVDMDDVDVFDASNATLVIEERVSKPTILNAFELISLNKGLDLSGFFEDIVDTKQHIHFASKHPAPEIIAKMEETAKPLGFDVHKCNYKMKLQGPKTGKKDNLSISTEVFEVAPSFYMVELRKASGDSLEYHEFCRSFSSGLEDIVWKSDNKSNNS